MNELQNPMTGFKLLEQAFSQGFRMRHISGTEDIYIEIDRFSHSAKMDFIKTLLPSHHTQSEAACV